MNRRLLNSKAVAGKTEDLGETGMDKYKDDEVNGTSRRGFLKMVAATGGAVAAVSAVGTVSAAEVEESEAPSEKLGYRPTEHIQDYYAKADF